MSNNNLPDLYGWPVRADGSLNKTKPRAAAWISDDGKVLTIKTDHPAKKMKFYQRTDVEKWDKK